MPITWNFRSRLAVHVFWIVPLLVGILQVGMSFYPDDCQIISFHLGTSNWLLGEGIMNIILAFLWMLVMDFLFSMSQQVDSESSDTDMPLTLFAAIYTIMAWKLAKFAWFIVGMVVLFSSNINCLKEGEGKAILMLISFIISVCMLKIYRANATVSGCKCSL
jgi:hypothetical protein